MAATRPVSTNKQVDMIVPSSRYPLKTEWTRHYWYVLFASSMQASPELSDADADLLVCAFKALRITLCCPECKKHFAKHWELYPYTTEEARDPEKSMQWVHRLRQRIAAEVSAQRAQRTESLHPPRGSMSCTPSYPGSVFSVDTEQEKEKRLQAGIAQGLREIAEHGDKAPCECTLGGKAYERPRW